MEPTFSKVDEATMLVTKSVEVKEETTEYNIDFLKRQEVEILKQKNEFVTARNAELAEIAGLILKCESLGIKPRVEVDLAVEVAKDLELSKITK